LIFAKVSGIVPSAVSQVAGSKTAVAAFACWQVADCSPMVVHSFDCQTPHGPEGAPLLTGPTDAAFDAAFADWM
jgi:hypothetical protein